MGDKGCHCGGRHSADSERLWEWEINTSGRMKAGTDLPEDTQGQERTSEGNDELPILPKVKSKSRAQAKPDRLRHKAVLRPAVVGADIRYYCG